MKRNIYTGLNGVKCKAFFLKFLNSRVPVIERKAHSRLLMSKQHFFNIYNTVNKVSYIILYLFKASGFTGLFLTEDYSAITDVYSELEDQQTIEI